MELWRRSGFLVRELDPQECGKLEPRMAKFFANAPHAIAMLVLENLDIVDQRALPCLIGRNPTGRNITQMMCVPE
eukprot:861937-Amphidinium_carterae.2